MKKIFIILLISLTLLPVCRKNDSTNSKQENENLSQLDPKYLENNSSHNIDFNQLKEIIDQSETMNVEVFFAISVLHKKYVEQFMEETKALEDNDQKDFFENRKDDFFKSIKYSSEEYHAFMENNQNSEEIIQYISQHKTIAEYLTTND